MVCGTSSDWLLNKVPTLVSLRFRPFMLTWSASFWAEVPVVAGGEQPAAAVHVRGQRSQLRRGQPPGPDRCDPEEHYHVVRVRGEVVRVVEPEARDAPGDPTLQRQQPGRVDRVDVGQRQPVPDVPARLVEQGAH